MDTLLLDFDYSPVTLRPCIAKLGQVGTYRKAGFVIAAIGSIVTVATPSFAVDSNNWDWNSESRQEQSEELNSGVRTNSGIDYQTGRTDRVVHNHQSEEPVDRDRQPQQTEPVAENQAPDSTGGQVIDDWRATRQSPEERMREQNPGVEKDCDGKPFSDADISQAELDADGNVTAEGFKQMGINRGENGKSFCQTNPSHPDCKLDSNGDAG